MEMTVDFERNYGDLGNWKWMCKKKENETLNVLEAAASVSSTRTITSSYKWIHRRQINTRNKYWFFTIFFFFVEHFVTFSIMTEPAFFMTKEPDAIEVIDMRNHFIQRQTVKSPLNLLLFLMRLMNQQMSVKPFTLWMFSEKRLQPDHRESWSRGHFWHLISSFSLMEATTLKNKIGKKNSNWYSLKIFFCENIEIRRNFFFKTPFLIGQLFCWAFVCFAFYNTNFWLSFQIKILHRQFKRRWFENWVRNHPKHQSLSHFRFHGTERQFVEGNLWLW